MNLLSKPSIRKQKLTAIPCHHAFSNTTPQIRERDDLIQIWNTNAARQEEAKVVEKVRSLLPNVKFGAIFYKREYFSVVVIH